MKIVSIATSVKKGIPKTIVNKAVAIKDNGIKGDVHSGLWHRQISFLSYEQIEGARDKGIDVTFGDFAKNIATTGINWETVPVGTRVKLGKDVLIEIIQIGKKCHNKCAIYYKADDCIMLWAGVFGEVLEGGKISNGDPPDIINGKLNYIS